MRKGISIEIQENQKSYSGNDEDVMRIEVIDPEIIGDKIYDNSLKDMFSKMGEII